MIIDWDAYELTVLSVASAQEVDTILARITGESVVLKGNSWSDTFHVIRARNKLTDRVAGIGVLSTSYGSQPALKTISDPAAVLLGFDDCLACVTLDDAKLAFEHRLHNLFHQFVPVTMDVAVVVLDEVGLTCITHTGRELWHYSASDVVTDWSLDGGIMVLSTMDGRVERVDLASGVPTSGWDKGQMSRGRLDSPPAEPADGLPMDQAHTDALDELTRADPIEVGSAIVHLHDQGFPIIASIYAVSRHYNLSLAEAKDVVTSAVVWHDVVAATEPMHDALIEIMRSDPMAIDNSGAS